MTEEAPLKPRFAPVPCRAISDKRLSGADLRVLSAVSAHDGLGKNGRHCDAGRIRLTYLCGINLATFSKSIRLLEQLGYVSVDEHPSDGRRRIWRVIYTAHDRSIMSSRTNPTDEEWVASRRPSFGEKGGEQTTQTAEISCLKNPQPSDFIDETKSNIHLKKENKFPERAKKFGESAAFEQALGEMCPHQSQSSRSVKSRVCEIERRWKAGELTSEKAVSSLTELYEESIEATDTNHIERLVDDIENAGSAV